MNQPKQLVKLAEKEAAARDRQASQIIERLNLLYRTSVEANALLLESLVEDNLSDTEKEAVQENLKTVKADLKNYRAQLINLRLNFLNASRLLKEVVNNAGIS